jgi:transposase
MALELQPRARCRQCNAWMRSPASAPRPPKSSSPNSGWTWASSPPPATWSPGPRSRRRPSSLAPSTAPGRPAKATRTCGGTLGEVAAAAAKTDTFLGERYRRLVHRRGKLKALVAIARSILVIVWHLLTDPTARFQDLGADYHTSRIDTRRKTRSLVRQLEALGHTVTLQPAA